MERDCIKLSFKKHNSYDRTNLRSVYCESFTITSTGYVAIYYFDGGYNCIYRAEDIVAVCIVKKHSIFANEEELEIHKNNFPSLYNPTYDIPDSQD